MAARPYRDWYSDVTRDPFIGNYPATYGHYAINAVNTPAEVRNRVFANGNTGVPIGHVLLVRPATAAAGDPGTIQGFHRTVRYAAGLGGATPFDNVGYAFLGDVHNGQLPHTVVWSDSYFNQVGDTQVPTSAYMDQLLAADPALQQVGPFAAGTADTEVVNTRYCMFIPNPYLTMLLDDCLTPREAWMQLRGAMVADGNVAACQPLIDWLRVALTTRTANAVTPLHRGVPAAQAVANLAEANAFQAFRTGILERDHPNLRTNQVTQGAQLVAQGLTDIAEQTRLQREADEARRLRDTNKTPGDLFPSGLERLMRWCQAATEADLPAIYTLAARHKKGERRKVLQDAVHDALETLGYHHDFPLSTKLSNKVFDLEWSSRLLDDLGLGLSIFTLGWVVDETAEVQKLRNAQADALYRGDAAPSLADTEAILDGSDDVHIPHTLAQLRYGVEQSHAMWYVLLGPGHPLVSEHSDYRRVLIEREMELAREVPRNPAHRFLVPALLARRMQVDVNVWLQDQTRTNRLVGVPTLSDVFGEIKRKRDWAPDLPAAYFQTTPPAHISDTESVMSGGSALTGWSLGTGAAPPTLPTLPTQGSGTPGGQSTGGAPTNGAPPPATQSVVLNQHPNDAFRPFKEMGLATKAVKQRCRDNNIAWPKNSRNQRFCLSFHIKGMCNTRCGNATDHHQHTPEEDANLIAWCTEHYKVE